MERSCFLRELTCDLTSKRDSRLLSSSSSLSGIEVTDVVDFSVSGAVSSSKLSKLMGALSPSPVLQGPKLNKYQRINSARSGWQYLGTGLFSLDISSSLSSPEIEVKSITSALEETWRLADVTVLVFLYDSKTENKMY